MFLIIVMAQWGVTVVCFDVCNSVFVDSTSRNIQNLHMGAFKNQSWWLVVGLFQKHLMDITRSLVKTIWLLKQFSFIEKSSKIH